jgi:TP901 family phage tail tape measure protein
MATLKTNITADASQFLKVIKEVLKSSEQAQKTIQDAFNSDIKIDNTGFKKAIADIEKTIDDLPPAEIEFEADKKSQKNIVGESAKVGKKSGKEFSVGFNSILKGALAVSAIQGIGNIAKDAVTGFIDLNKNVANIGTLGVENFEEFTNLALEASKSVPDSAANIAAGAYQAISAGITGTNEEIIKFTETASKVATAGLATTEEAVNGLTSVLNAYGKEASDVNEVSDTFFAAIKLGKTSFNELNAGLANVIPAASAAGIGFEEIAGNIAQITALGVPTAQATTQLRSAIVELQKPGAELAKVMSGVAVEVDGVQTTLNESNIGKVLEEQGLTKTLQQIEQSAAASGKTLTQAFSSSQAASAALLLTGENAERANKTLANVRKEIEGGVSTEAYEVAAQSLDAQLSVINNQAQAVFAQIFEAVRPILNTILDAVQPLISGISVIVGNFDKLAIGVGAAAVAFGAYTLVTQGSAIATKAAAGATEVLNKVMALNPAAKVALAVGVLTAAVLTLVDAFSDSTEELISSNELEKELLESKEKRLKKEKEQIKSNRDLIAEYENTGKRVEELQAKENLSGKEKTELAKKTNELKKQQIELNKSYPDAIDATGKFSDNLKSVKEQTGLQNANLSKLTENNKKLIQEFEELGNVEDKSTEQKKRLKEVTEELNKEFPKAGVNSEDFAGSLSRVKTEAGLTFGELERVNGQLSKVAQRQVKAAQTGAKLAIRSEIEATIEAIDDSEKALFGLVDTFGTSGGEVEGKLVSIVNTFAERLQGKTGDEFERIALDFEGTFAESIERVLKKEREGNIETGVDIDIDKLNEARQRIFKIIDKTREYNELQQTLNGEANTNNQILEETSDKLDTNNKILDTTKDKVKKVADLYNFITDLFTSNPIKINTEFELSDIGIDDALDFFNNGTTLTGDKDVLNEINKELERVAELKKTITETDQFIQLQIEGKDKIISDLSSVRNEKDKILNDLEDRRLDLSQQIVFSSTDEQRNELLKQLDALQDDIIDQTIKTSTKSNLTREELEQASNERIKKLRLDNLEAINSEVLEKEKSLNELRADFRSTSERDLQKLRLELADETNENLKQKEVLEAQERFAELLNKFRGSEEAKLLIKKAYDNELRDIDKKYTVTATSLYEDLAKNFAKSISSYDPQNIIDKNKEVEDSINSVKSEYEKETDVLNEQLKNREISYSEYNTKIVDLENKKNEKLKELESERFDFVDIINDQLTESFKKLANNVKETFEQQSQAVIGYQDKLTDYQKQLEEGVITELEYNELTTQAQKDKEDALTSSYEAIAVSSGATLASLIADGESFTTALARTALEGLQALVPVFIAEIFGQSLGQLGPIAGPVVAGALTATLQGLISVAQSSIGGANDGVIGLSEGNKGKPKGKDSILMMLAPNESVITSQATAKNKPYLEFINKGGSIADLINPNVYSSDMGETNSRLMANTKEISELRKDMRKLRVNHFYDKQPKVTLNNNVVIKSQRGVL